MADTGFKSPTVNVPGDGWIDGANAYSSNNSYATCFEEDGYVIYFSTFAFGVPAGKTIDGIEVTVEGKSSGTSIMKIRIWSASVGAYSLIKTSAWTITEQVFTLGGAADLWGTTWVTTDFSDANFILFIGTPTSGVDNMSLDHAQVKVYYSDPASGPANLKSYNTNLKANIKSINGNLIANIKSLNTNV